MTTVGAVGAEMPPEKTFTLRGVGRVGNTASKERIFGLAGVGRKLGKVPIGDG